jgi:hypothetical protein
MKTLARLSTRGTGNDGTKTVDLILGVGFKENSLKPNFVYEIQEILGELVIKEIGPSALKYEGWAHCITEILEIDQYKKACFFTDAELIKAFSK